MTVVMRIFTTMILFRWAKLAEETARAVLIFSNRTCTYAKSSLKALHAGQQATHPGPVAFLAISAVFNLRGQYILQQATSLVPIMISKIMNHTYRCRTMNLCFALLRAPPQLLGTLKIMIAQGKDHLFYFLRVHLRSLSHPGPIR